MRKFIETEMSRSGMETGFSEMEWLTNDETIYIMA